jgi:hypothetical protein
MSYYGGSNLKKEIRKLMVITSIISSFLLLTIAISFLSLLQISFISHSRIIIYIAAAASALLIFIWVVSMELVKADRSDKAEGLGIYVLEAGMSILLPVYIYMTGLFKGDKDDIRRVFIKINNLVVKHNLQKHCPSKMLMLLPGCMQNKDCSCKITEDIINCRRCGKCRIGELTGLVERFNVRANVVKGGTAARNVAKKYKPDFIIAVACERELMSGMADVGRIPVIGIINQRPNGYCTNTTVDILHIKEILMELEEKGLELRGTRQGAGKCSEAQKNY